MAQYKTNIMKTGLNRSAMQSFDWSECMARVLLVFLSRTSPQVDYVSIDDLRRHGVSENSWHNLYKPVLLDLAKANKNSPKKPLIEEVIFEEGNPLRKYDCKYYRIYWDLVLEHIFQLMIKDIEKVEKNFLDYSINLKKKLKKKSKGKNKISPKTPKDNLLIRINTYKKTKNPIILGQLSYEFMSLKQKELSIKQIKGSLHSDSSNSIKRIETFFLSKQNEKWLKHKLKSYFLSLLHMNARLKTFDDVLRDFLVNCAIMHNYTDLKENTLDGEFNKIAIAYSKYSCLNPDAITALYWEKDVKEHREALEREEKEYVQHLIETGKEDLLSSPAKEDK